MAEEKESRESARLRSSRVFLLPNLSKRLPDTFGHLIFWFLCIGGIVLDLWAKAAVFRYLSTKPGYSVTIMQGFFNLVTALNYGAFLGLFGGQSIILVLVSFIALTVVLSIFLFGGSKSRCFQGALGLLAAGICGNLYDRLFNAGGVRDFIDVCFWPGKHWPAFNIADTLLCIAVGLIILCSFIQKPCRRHDQPHK